MYEFTTYKTSTWPSGGSDYEFDEEGPAWRSVAGDPPRKGHAFAVYVSELDIWYCGPDPTGGYMYRKNQIPDDKVYNPNASLEEKCD